MRMRSGRTPTEVEEESRLNIDGYEDVRNKNLGFYDNNTESYFNLSYGAFNLESLYKRFLDFDIPEGGKILDAGCGSGRDALNFVAKGYNVTAFDGSKGMVDMLNDNADRMLKQIAPDSYNERKNGSFADFECLHKDFLEIDFKNEFDAIWSAAALLHLPTEAFDKALTNLSDALKTDGTMYFSIKKLENGFLDDGARSFYNPGQDHLKEMFDKLGLKLVDYWETGKQNDPNQTFENYILKKVD